MIHTIIVEDVLYEFEDYTQYLNFIANRYGFKTWEAYLLSQTE
jgi:hypothetical protein